MPEPGQFLHNHLILRLVLVPSIGKVLTAFLHIQNAIPRIRIPHQGASSWCINYFLPDIKQVCMACSHLLSQGHTKFRALRHTDKWWPFGKKGKKKFSGKRMRIEGPLTWPGAVQLLSKARSTASRQLHQGSTYWHFFTLWPAPRKSQHCFSRCSDTSLGVLSHFSRVWLFAAPHTVAHRLLCPRYSPGKNTGWVVMPSSRGSTWPRDRTHSSYVSCTGRQVLYTSATWEDPWYPPKGKIKRFSHEAEHNGKRFWMFTTIHHRYQNPITACPI